MRFPAPAAMSVACALLAGFAAPTPQADRLEQAHAAFRELRFFDAIQLFEGAVAESPPEVSTLCWLAESRRRLGLLPEAAQAARAALALDPHSAFAHTVVADCYDPVMSTWEEASADTTWAHLQLALAHDPPDGDALLRAWKHAVVRRDTTRERLSLLHLGRIGFFVPAVLAYNRWQLEHLPRRAVLLTNGDMDTHPALVLQAASGVRTDVTIVNLSLLDWPDYALVVAGREALPLPDGLDSPEVRHDRYFSDGREPGGVKDRIVATWVESLERGRFRRPLAVAASVDLGQTPALEGRLTLAGPYHMVVRDPPGDEFDLRRLRTAAASIPPAAFAGPWVSELDRSPIRRQGTRGLSDNLYYAAIRWGQAELSGHHRAGALAALAKLDSLAAVIAPAERFQPAIDRLRRDAAPR